MAKHESDAYKEKFRPATSSLDQEVEAALAGVSLDDLYQQQAPQQAPASEGGKYRRGKIISVTPDDAIVDMGGKSQGILPAIQFENDPLPAVGDTVEVEIEGYQPGEGFLILSRQGAVQAAAWETLEEGQIVEGRVTGHNKGGLELEINGLRAFMPISQIEMFRVEDLGPYNNQRLRCEISEVNREDRNIIVSRKTLLEREAAEAREKAFGALAEGQILKGTVRTIMPYGAFVDIGGVDGLLHVSDMSYSRVNDPNSVVQPGQPIEVKVLKIDPATRKISLGLKQVLPDPWAGAEDKWPVQSKVRGTVTKLMDFGAFVEIEPGVEGLIPMSEFTYLKRIKHPSEVLKQGDTVDVRVMSVDVSRKRISLSLKQLGDDPWMGASARWAVKSIVQGTVKRITDFGAFVELVPGVEGLVHISEVSENRVRAVRDALQEGQVVQAKVLEVDEENHRISLSIKQVRSMPEYTGEISTEAQAAPEPAPASQPKRKKPLKGGF
jgi:small subunit ribosomal protein S1